jgi:hypothetical protein
MEKASDSPTTVAKIMKHNKEIIHHFKLIVIIFFDRLCIHKICKKGLFVPTYQRIEIFALTCRYGKPSIFLS